MAHAPHHRYHHHHHHHHHHHPVPMLAQAWTAKSLSCLGAACALAPRCAMSHWWWADWRGDPAAWWSWDGSNSWDACRAGGWAHPAFDREDDYWTHSGFDGEDDWTGWTGCTNFQPETDPSFSTAFAEVPRPDRFGAQMKEEDAADPEEGTGQAPAAALEAPAAALEPTAPVQRRGPRLYCHIFLFKRVPEFDLIPMLIGKEGRNTRDISERTFCKIRVRGRGSGHRETNGWEARVPLMVAVSTQESNEARFKIALQNTFAKLEWVDNEFCQFCKDKGWPPPTKRLFCIGELSKNAVRVLGEALRDSGRILPLSADAGAGYDSLAACLCSSPWVSRRLKEAVQSAAFATPSRVPLRPYTGEVSGAEATEADESELAALISAQVSAYLQDDS